MNYIPHAKQKSNYFTKEILPKHTSKKSALKDYLKKIVIFQSTNKKNQNWNELRLSALDMTLRQISDRTGVPLTTVHRTVKEMVKDGILKLYRIKKSQYRQNMVFYYFPDIKAALIKKKAYKLAKKAVTHCKRNTRNIFYKYKKKYKWFLWQLSKRQSSDPYLNWDFDKNTWGERIERTNKPLYSISDMLKFLN